MGTVWKNLPQKKRDEINRARRKRYQNDKAHREAKQKYGRDRYRRSKNWNVRPWIHRLSEIDEENRTAVCAACGPVKLSNGGPSYSKKRSKNWRCRNAWNTQRRQQMSKKKNDTEET